MPSDEREELHAASMEPDHISIDADAFGDIRIDYQGVTYHLVKRGEDGLALERE